MLLSITVPMDTFSEVSKARRSPRLTGLFNGSAGRPEKQDTCSVTVGTVPKAVLVSVRGASGRAAGRSGSVDGVPSWASSDGSFGLVVLLL